MRQSEAPVCADSQAQLKRLETGLVPRSPQLSQSGLSSPVPSPNPKITSSVGTNVHFSLLPSRLNGTSTLWWRLDP